VNLRRAILPVANSQFQGEHLNGCTACARTSA
jgi:hypothetical protein